MPINQLFSKKPPIDLINKIFVSMGHLGVHDKREFSKLSFTKEVIEKMQTHLDSLAEFYIMSKRKIYLSDINSKKIITVLKQIIRLHDYKLISREKFIKEFNKKITVYTVNSTKPKRPNLSLSFD